ncbi:MAG: hypothetical protein M3456_04315 [Actinomycetota bacterium]|nr:hypothetical protein [Actinomycetota bacterium]
MAATASTIALVVTAATTGPPVRVPTASRLRKTTALVNAVRRVVSAHDTRGTLARGLPLGSVVQGPKAPSRLRTGLGARRSAEGKDEFLRCIVTLRREEMEL